MPTINWPLLHISAMSTGLMVLAYLFRGHRDRSRTLIALFGLSGLLLNALSYWGPRVDGANHWITHFSALISVLTVVPGMAWSLRSARQRTFWMWMVLAYVVVWIPLVLGVEDRTGFSRLGYSLNALLLLGVALWVLLVKSLEESPVPVNRHGWFWIAIGVSVYATASLVYTPTMSRLLAAERNDLAIHVAHLRAGFNLVAYLLIAWGMWRPVIPASPEAVPATHHA